LDPALKVLFSEKNLRKIWKELRNSYVPVVNVEDYAQIPQFRLSLLNQVANNAYVPSIGHGYLGFPKSNGCTRFVPVLTKEDLAIYYLVSLSLQTALAYDLPNIFGGWQRPPETISNSKKTAENEFFEQISDPYLAESMSKKMWFKNWTDFNTLLRETFSASDTGNYVMTTDIANFYDTIDIHSLTRGIRSEVSGAEFVVDLLEYFLSSWDRRLKGYKPSSKGIPQELLGDASRLYSHFYFKNFDLEFTEQCENNGIIYIRWADDIILIGNSRKSLEESIHRASKLLLKYGLNLNSSKTKCYSKSEFRMYRGLDVLDAVSRRDQLGFNATLRQSYNFSQTHSVRLDTISKSAISFMIRNSDCATKTNIAIVDSMASEYSILSTFAFQNFRNLIELTGGTNTQLDKYLKVVLSKPYAAPKAQFLKFLWHYPNLYPKIGLTKRGIGGAASRIYNASSDSKIIQEICMPKFMQKHGQLPNF
jgi:Reverse transcriptase (RNA-dependent DNA polymerase)